MLNSQKECGRRAYQVSELFVRKIMMPRTYSNWGLAFPGSSRSNASERFRGVWPLLAIPRLCNPMQFKRGLISSPPLLKIRGWHVMSCDEICRNVVVMIGTVVFLLIETSQNCSFRIGRTRSRSIRSIDKDPLIYSIVETTSLIGLRAECFPCLLRSMGNLQESHLTDSTCVIVESANLRDRVTRISKIFGPGFRLTMRGCSCEAGG
jgi:hypothetical protein